MKQFTSARPPRRAFATLCAASLLLLADTGARACEPCQAKLDLPKSLEKADLVLVARRASETKLTDGPSGGPACDELLVEDVLKGEFAGKRLRVRSWYGMCPYGIILDEGSYVVLLRKVSSSEYEMAAPEDECARALKEKPELYAAVEWGCAVRHLAIKSGSVEAEGVKLTLEEFRGKYGLRPGAGERGGPRSGLWPGGYFGAGLLAPAADYFEVTQ